MSIKNAHLFQEMRGQISQAKSTKIASSEMFQLKNAHLIQEIPAQSYPNLSNMSTDISVMPNQSKFREKSQIRFY